MRYRCKITLVAIRLKAEGMPRGRSRVGSTSHFLRATRYVVLKIFAILGGRSPWMIREKKEASVSGLTNVVEFFIRDLACDAAVVSCRFGSLKLRQNDHYLVGRDYQLLFVFRGESR